MVIFTMSKFILVLGVDCKYTLKSAQEIIEVVSNRK